MLVTGGPPVRGGGMPQRMRVTHKEARDLPAAESEPIECISQDVLKGSHQRLTDRGCQIAKDVVAACKQGGDDETGGDLEKTISVYERGDGKRLAVFDPQ